MKAKVKIKLTKEQIDTLIGEKSKLLTTSFEEEVDRLTKKHQSDLIALRKQFDTYEITIDDEAPIVKRGRKNKIDEGKLKKLFGEGKPIADIARTLDASYAGITSKVKKLKLERPRA